jgi:DNA polymerase-1
MILQVHDELVFDVAAKDREALSALIINKMENAIALDVPIKAEVGYGANWLEAH